MRARGAERVLEGNAVTAEVIGCAGRMAAAECRAISDVRASERYRRLLTETLVTRALTRCVERIAAQGAR
jgi:carbon-monoxide dehydrogenase medium subunit